MDDSIAPVLPIFLFGLVAVLLAGGMLALGRLLGPRREGRVKQMPYESGMDPIHEARRRFDVRFHLLAVAFLVFDVELLFLYPWAVASKHPHGMDAAVGPFVSSRQLVFAGVMTFVFLLLVGFVYDWRKGLFRWR